MVRLLPGILMKAAESSGILLTGKLPAEMRFRMPAEWDRHEATWLSWPQNPITWPEHLPRVEETYAQMVKHLASGEIVNILVQNAKHEKHVSSLLKKHQVNLSQVLFFLIPTADSWIRDYGPIFITRRDSRVQERAFVNWIYNAWGDKYDDLKADNDVPLRLLSFLQMNYFEPGIVLEGGSIEVNGEGLLLTTEQCLLNKNRNPHLKREEIERYLRDYLGVEKIIWLKEGIVGDDTDGHIDDIARFVNPTTVVCAVEEDKTDENYTFLRRNFEILKEQKMLNGKKLNVVALPMPGRVEDEEGRLPASYANFYIGNDAVLVPVYGHDNDQKALDILKPFFPGRKVVGIPSKELVEGLGSIHCVTQQQPALLL